MPVGVGLGVVTLAVKVTTVFSNWTGVLWVTATALGILLMTSLRTAELAPVKLVSPAKDAVMACVPMASDEVVKVAIPEALMEPTPRTVVPSRKVMAPVAPVFVTAVKVTDWPVDAGLTDDVSVTLPAALATLTV